MTAKTELERSLKMCIINKYKAQTTLFNIQVKWIVNKKNLKYIEIWLLGGIKEELT